MRSRATALRKPHENLAQRTPAWPASSGMANPQILQVFQRDRADSADFGRNPQMASNVPHTTLGRRRKMAVGACLIDRLWQLLSENLRDLIDRNIVLCGQLANRLVAEHLLQFFRRDGQILAVAEP